MGKLLRVLVIIQLVLAIGALTMGCLLFLRREVLKARTQALEERLIQIGAYIEQTPGTMEAPGDVSRDTSPCEAQVLAGDEIERSQFWSTYNYNLESTEPEAVVNLGEKQNDLMTYYLKDPVTGKIARDPLTKLRISKGEGTMWTLLEGFKDQVSAQYNLLNTTREALKSLRSEYIDTINDLNNQKEILRTKLVKIVELEAEIVRLNEKIRSLEEKISELEATIAELKVQIADLQRQIGLLEETVAERDDEIVELNMTISNLIGQIEGDKEGVEINVDIEEGPQGTVASVNEQWHFLSADLSHKCMVAFLGEELDAEYDPKGFEMYVERVREGVTPQFITKIRLKWIDREAKRAIFDIVPGWTQLPPKKGDIVYRHRTQSHPFEKR